MPTVLTGSGLGAGLDASGKFLSDYFDWKQKQADDELKRKALKQELEQSAGEYAHKQKQWGYEDEARAADAEVGAQLPKLADVGQIDSAPGASGQPAQPRGPSTGSDAFFAPPAQATGQGGVPSLFNQLHAPSEAQRFDYHVDELDKLKQRHAEIWQQIAPKFSKLSPGMQKYVLGQLGEAASREREEMDKRHAMEGLNAMLEKGAWGPKEWQYAQHAMATAAGMVQAGQVKEGMAAAEDAAKVAASRVARESVHADSVAKGQTLIAGVEQLEGEPNPEARALLAQYAADGISEQEYQEQLPHILKHEVKTSDNLWMDKRAAAAHETVLQKLKEATLANVESGIQTREDKAVAGAELRAETRRKDRASFIAELIKSGMSGDEARAMADKEMPKIKPSPFGKEGSPDEQEPDSDVDDQSRAPDRLIGNQEAALDSGSGDQRDPFTPNRGGAAPDDGTMTRRAAYIQQLLKPTDNDEEAAKAAGFGGASELRQWRLMHAAALTKRWGLTEWVKKQRDAKEAKDAADKKAREKALEGTKMPMDKG